MRYVKQSYYDDFKCIADKCPDTCCAGWQIVIDEESLGKYEDCIRMQEKCNSKEVHNDTNAVLAGLLSKGTDLGEGCFKQCEGRCAMLNEKNLCNLIIAGGEDWLCETCKKYPRHIEEFDGIREMSLSLSCPVAAEIMLKSEEKMQFLITEDEKADPLEDEFEDFDFLLYTQLEDAREVLFSIVQNRALPIENRMALIMQMAKEMQECLDEARLFDMEDVIGKYAKEKTCILTENSSTEVPAGEEDFRTAGNEALNVEKRFQYLKVNFELFYELERLRPEWSEVADATKETLYAGESERYLPIYNAFEKEFVTGFGKKRWGIFLEQILMFFLYTYFCGAVYDDCIYSKVGMAVFSATYIQEFVMCAWYLNDKKMDFEECIRIAYRYAREVEHSDENIIALEEWLLERM